MARRLVVAPLGAVLWRVRVALNLLRRQTFADGAVAPKKIEADAHVPKDGVNPG